MSADFQPTFVLRASKRKMLLLLVGSLVLSAGGVLAARTDPLAGYACTVFFGLCAAVGGISLHPRAAYLEVTAQGFAFASLFRRTFVRWQDVDEFVPFQVQLHSMVGWRYAPTFQGRSFARALSTSLADVEAGLPDTYGMPAADLAALLNRARAAHLTGLDQGASPC